MKAIVIGVGRRGSDCVSKLSSSSDDVTLLYADTDIDDLERHPSGHRLHLGSNIPLEAFERNNIAFSFNATMSERAFIEARLSGADVLILVAGLGGGTGAGGSRALATIAHDLDIPVAALVTRPFSIEGEDRVHRGRRAARELEEKVDLFIPFFQDQLVSFAERGTRVRDLIGIVDEVMSHAVEGVIDVVACGQEPVKRSGLGPLQGSMLFSYGVSEDPRGAVEAAKFAFHGPFFEGVSLGKTGHLVLAAQSRDVLPSEELDRASTSLLKRTSENAGSHVYQRTYPSIGNKVLLAVFLGGRFGEPTPSMGEFFVPGPTG